jgi:ribokinase
MDSSEVLVVGGIFREVIEPETRRLVRYGGSGLTAAVAASRLGAQVTIAGAVGAEDVEAVEATLVGAGVQPALVLTKGASGTFVFPESSDPRRPWPLYRPAEASPGVRPALADAAVVACFGIPDLDPLAEGWLEGITAHVLLWDRQGWLSRARDNSGALAVVAERRVYLANSREAIDDAEAVSLEDALALQPPAGFIASLIKDGNRGVTVVERSDGEPRVQHAPPLPVDAISTIGSGDVFAGSVAASLAAGADLATAARRGCVAAAVAIERGDNLLQAADRNRIDALLGSAQND